jgi:hypothetical protein
MPDLTDATRQARVIARRGVHAATAMIDASFHPFRTVRNGTDTVRHLLHADHEQPTPPPTDAKTEVRPEAKAETKAGTKTEAKNGAKPAGRTAPSAPKPPAPRKTVDQVVEETLEQEQPPANLPVEPQGPAPHLPPSLAAEIERDYGDDLPGFSGGDAAREE